MVGLWGALCLLQYCCCCADRRCNWVSMIATNCRFRVCLLDMRTIRGANIIIERGHHLMIACPHLRVSYASSEKWGASTSRGSLWNTAAVQQWENYLADCNDLRDKMEFVITLIKEVEAAEKNFLSTAASFRSGENISPRNSTVLYLMKFNLLFSHSNNKNGIISAVNTTKRASVMTK